ncbi:exosortase/archaeosortase family protein [Amycolatopsis antarctica]|uniref:Exosortase/archaeosortase family protein n=1 Tax=Amycolatopsis antarctica TaxID=1854586 RepID=A0A263DD32_9PSEU|nr:exosortase P [Amycolatopsis antarctica]OZM75305.1 exosortase/archaeosortase family protein [Amycolatopsis antarctica]
MASLIFAAALVAFERGYRELEVQFFGLLIRAVSTQGVYVAGHRETVYFGLGGDSALGLRMTPECSSVFMLLPLLLVSAVLLWLGPRSVPRLLTSFAVGGLAIILVNQARLFGIAGLVDRFGTDEGYYWGHTLLGSLVSVIGGAIALVLFVRLATRRPRAERARP